MFYIWLHLKKTFKKSKQDLDGTLRTMISGNNIVGFGRLKKVKVSSERSLDGGLQAGHPSQMECCLEPDVKPACFFCKSHCCIISLFQFSTKGNCCRFVCFFLFCFVFISLCFNLETFSRHCSSESSWDRWFINEVTGLDKRYFRLRSSLLNIFGTNSLLRSDFLLTKKRH